MSLFEAAATGNRRLVETLAVTEAYNVNQKENGRTPLSVAAQFGFEDVCNILIKYGAEPDICDDDGETPLKMASSKGHLGVVWALVQSDTVYCDIKKRYAEIDFQGQKWSKTALYIALENRQIHVAEFLFRRGASLKSLDREQFELLVKNDAFLNNKNLVNQLSRDGTTPLAVAVEKGFLEAIELLIRNGAVNNYNKALLTAIRAGNIDSIRCLVEKCCANTCEPDEYGYTPLKEAVKTGNLEMVKYLIENNAEVTIPSAFFTAIVENQSEIFKFLLSFDVDVNAQNSKGEFPLLLAAKNADFLEMLIERGASVDCRGEDASTALLIATENNNLESVEVLISHGANVNSQNADKETPLYKAVIGLLIVTLPTYQ